MAPINIHPDQPLMPEEQLSELFREVQDGMVKNFLPCLTELYFPAHQHPDVLENGTGAFAVVDGTKLLVTNEHVINKMGLSHSFFGSEVFVPAASQRYGVANSLDVGVARVDMRAWADHGSEARAIEYGQFAEKHDTAPHEILWMAGYPGARVKQFDQLNLAVCEATPTQEYLFLDGEEPHESFDPWLHFAVYYSPANAKPLFGTDSSSSPGRSNPPGLSGSLVWNTRRLQCFYENRPWSPNLAVVTGIIWGWPNSNYLIATKVEHFRKLLRDMAKLPDSPIELA